MTTMTTSPMHEVKTAAAVIADDVICQSFIQSSSTLAYACLAVRQRKFDLAAHVLHSLEAKQASRFKDMVFYLQAQIGIETGEFAMVKKRLVPRVHQHPNDMVALSLLECCVYHEFAEWEKDHPAPPQGPSPSLPGPAAFPGPPGASPFGNAQAAAAAAYAATFDGSEPFAQPIPSPAAMAVSGAVKPFPGPAQSDDPVPSLIGIKLKALPGEPSDAPAVAKAAPAAPHVPAPRPASTGGTPADTELGFYQTVSNDANTLAMALWNAGKGKLKTVFRNPELEPLVTLLPRELPGAVQTACAALESGAVHKICFCFQNLTATTFHAGAENMALVTGNVNQSLLTIVRGENTFRKAAAAAPSAPGPASAPRSVEHVPNE
jgi:hypothetical protein